jgi:hypothetical protein
MLKNTCISFDRNGAGPCIAHVTWVSPASRFNSNSATLCASNGFRKSSFIVTLDGTAVSTISICPTPIFSLCHA